MKRSRSEPKFTRLTSEQRRAELVQAGLACMARGGIQEFTVDKICAEVGVSRGLITHHFGSMNGLLAAVYGSMYESDTLHLEPLDEDEPRLVVLLNRLLSPEVFNRDSLKIWLALWGQIAVNSELAAEHKRQYGRYRDNVARAIAKYPARKKRKVDAEALAQSLICLIDGLSLQHCIDPTSLSLTDARSACMEFLKPHLGRLVL